MGKYWFNIDVAPIWEQLRRINLMQKSNVEALGKSAQGGENW